ncbi:hypothetical protein H8E88_12555 [candidate division KSB1 bacterium]|nr:hypothetical protein [candidate division KSB1 bacterium]
MLEPFITKGKKMKIRIILIINALLTIALSQDQIYKLQYISPTDLIESLGLTGKSNQGYSFNSGIEPVFLHINPSNNQLKISGSTESRSKVIDLIEFYDVPPKQIIIEVKIIEINNQQLNDVGMDWQNLLEKLRFNVSFDINKINEKGTSTHNSDRLSLTSRFATSNIVLGDLLDILRQKEIGKVVNAPRIVTTNNQLGSILDGQHSTYVTRYSSYSNLYETEELNSGLSLEVTPSIGESGFMSLDIQAKYTYISGNISGSPVETGQILKNRVIVKNETPFLLGSFKQIGNQSVKRKTPILGTILPFFFSKKVEMEIEKNILVVLTPYVIDLEGSEVPEIK